MTDIKRLIVQHSTYHIGGAIATGLSYATNHSLLWALLHGFLNWAYIAYWAASRYA